jgi:hypothetical protein
MVIAAFIALAGLAIAASRSSLSIGLPAAAAAAAGSSSPAPTALPDVPDLAAIATPRPTTVVAPVAVPAVLAEAPTAGAPTELPPSPPVPSVPQGKPCAQLSLPAPSQVGGIQNLVRLIPLFGPFSPEAFAMLPALQPGIAALGPLFPVFESGLDQLAPVLDAATPLVQQLSDAGFAALAPLYLPYRQTVLDGEAQLVAFLQPVVTSLATAPGSECLLALEGLLASLQPGAQ